MPSGRVSSADIDKGARWSSDLAKPLATAKAGIICLTPNNFAAPYILFESGALSKTVDKSFVCTLLIGMEPSDVSGPLADFQATKPTRDDLLHLLTTLNKALGESAVEDAQLQAAFEVFWPKIEGKLGSLPPDGPTDRPHRTERELLEELVDSMRSRTAWDTVNWQRAEQTLNLIVTRLSNTETSSRPDPYTWTTDMWRGGVRAERVEPDLTKLDLARHYDEVAKNLGSDTPSGSAVPTANAVATLPIGSRRAAARKARAKIGH